MLTLIGDSEGGVHSRDIVVLRQELAQAERELRGRAEHEAVLLAKAERVAWRQAREDCLQFERIRRNAQSRLEAIRRGERERFPSECVVAEMTLRDVKAWELLDSTAYTIISFASMRERLRFLRGGTEREAVIRQTLTRGGVYTQGGYFQGILK